MEKMSKYPDYILEDLATCGLSCRKCLYKKDGEIAVISRKLADLFGENFESYADRFSTFKPEFKNYKSFRAFVDFIGEQECTGCRKGEGCYPGCVVASCTREKTISFCFECPEFPCARVNFDPDLKKRWIIMNERMREVGLEKYHEETKDICRYV
ncbi:DUF3795 domain-containing protein [Desulforegula conservatrix]|uniref:DUF3795 domain-containing protein n=1 Tax=Desulforegula conservatrix TaxID=153026 RepID=UPI00042A85BB|nr:DUF3795 domain-containing protein [Desulforegula conservatrix]